MNQENEEAIKEYKVLQFLGGKVQPFEQWISEEMPLTIYLNGVDMSTMLCSPVDQKYLVMGFLVSEGMIRGIEYIG